MKMYLEDCGLWDVVDPKRGSKVGERGESTLKDRETLKAKDETATTKIV